MTHPIKFRVWNRVTHSWLDEFAIDNDGDIMIRGWFDDDHKTWELDYNYHKSNYVIQQFIGFSDKNGREIYEGDIIALGNIKYLIQWHGLGYCGFDITVKDMYKIEPDSFKKFEVIGNEFENPEMIEKK